MKRSFWAVLILLGILTLTGYRVVNNRRAWDAQPATVKAAAEKLQQDLSANAKQHDLVRYKDGHLAIVESFSGNDGLRLKNCGDFQSYPIDAKNLAQQALARIPYSSPEYGDAAKECLAYF